MQSPAGAVVAAGGESGAACGGSGDSGDDSGGGGNSGDGGCWPRCPRARGELLVGWRRARLKLYENGTGVNIGSLTVNRRCT